MKSDSLQKYKLELEKELDRILDVFIAQYKPQKVVLFGSLANGNIKDTSDIDMLVIKDTDKRYWERIDEVFHLIHPEEPLDIFVLTSKEVEDNLKKDNVYLKEILENGKVLYERTDP